jgi:hypothetical protein
VIESRRMRWMGNVACTGGMRNLYKVLVRNLKEDLTVDGRILL